MYNLFIAVAMIAAVIAFSDTLPAAAAQTKYNFSSEKPRIPSRFRRQTVDYKTRERPGTIVINTRDKFLYFVLGDNKAIRYGIGVGREGFGWSGVQRISRKAEWPSWRPPAEMRRREPHLPAFMPGGINNPLGARALYLGATLYRIHGTREASTIGRNVSSGCIRVMNDDVIDLYKRARVGSKVIVL